MINNGNFNSDFVRHKAQQYYQEFVAGPNGVTQKNPSQSQLPYHITSQLPPSISGMGNFATIKYYVKVTCKRSSIFKVNLRSFEPFTFLPLETDPPSNENEEELYKEVFVRKEVIFKNRIPSIVGVEVPPEPNLKFSEYHPSWHNKYYRRNKGFSNDCFLLIRRPTSITAFHNQHQINNH